MRLTRRRLSAVGFLGLGTGTLLSALADFLGGPDGILNGVALVAALALIGFAAYLLVGASEDTFSGPGQRVASVLLLALGAVAVALGLLELWLVR